jgi:hypothetical protein
MNGTLATVMRGPALTIARPIRVRYVAEGSDALAGMGNIKAAGEIGGFVEKSFGPRRAWRTRGVDWAGEMPK